MSLQDARRKTRSFNMPVICFRCDAPMKIKTVIPAMTSLSLDEVVYHCPACKDETTQTVLRDD
jgi:predicted nucleic acid-binding Zn ribbon protein